MLEASRTASASETTEALGTLKIRVIRFRNEEVLYDLSSVLERITAALEAP